MRNRWIRAAIAAAILFVVVVLIVIGCMKHKAPAKLSANSSAGKSTHQTAPRKIRTERKRANARDSIKPCVIAPSVATQQHSKTAAQENGLSDSAHALETEKQPDPAFRLFLPPAQAGRRPSNSGWQHFRPQIGD